jgi:hypothetical protein
MGGKRRKWLIALESRQLRLCLEKLCVVAPGTALRLCFAVDVGIGVALLCPVSAFGP